MMREDMHKVIVEMPRGYSHNPYRHDGRTYRNRETTPSRIGMKDGYYRTKWFSDSLGPLIAFLHKRAGRPWDTVYSEICAHVDLRSTVKRHLLEHLQDFVAIHTRWDGKPPQGRVWIPKEWGPQMPLEKSDIHMYVHPLTGILMENEFRLAARIAERKKRIAELKASSEKRRVISVGLQLIQQEGTWYIVELDRLPEPSGWSPSKGFRGKFTFVYRWDCVENRMVSLDKRSHYGALSAQSRADLYGDEGWYAKSKRQLNKRELKKYGVANKAHAGLVCFWRNLAKRFAAGWTIFPMFGIR